MYKRMITYNFTDDNTRDSFVKMIETLGFEQQPDQSTYAQPKRNPSKLSELKAIITVWSAGESLTADDGVQIYVIGNNNTINRIDMGYSKTSKKLV